MQGDEVTDGHWFNPPPALCEDCGLPFGEGDHLLTCDSVWTVTGSGFAFCRLVRFHDGPHELVNWDGGIWRADDTGCEQIGHEPQPGILDAIETTLPPRYRKETP